MQLRDYQQRVCDEIFAAWDDGKRYVLAVLPTGAGKTVVFCHVVHQIKIPTVIMAHRGELVSQMSVALAREGVRHRVIGPPALTRMCVRAHLKVLKYSYIDPNSKVAVASMQSIASHKQDWYNQVRLWVHDEAHHLLRDNQFGKAVACFPNAIGLGVTATPVRADGRGLGLHADGFFEHMIVGPTPRDLIERKFLSEYRIYAPPNNFNREQIKVSANGEFDKQELKVETKHSGVMGDAAAHYKKHAYGKLGLTFCDSIDNAVIMVGNYRAQGVSAEMVSGKTHSEIRTSILDKFASKQILQLVSVSLIDEGFDCPAVEVVSDVAASESYARFAQRFGRGMRILEGKTHMIYFDHVGNVLRHGLPDAPRVWTLDRRERKKKRDPDTIPLTVCLECLQPYERTRKRCPYCDHYAAPAQRGAPDFVDGDLTELDADTLKALRGDIARKDGDFYAPVGLSIPAQVNARSGWMRRQEQQRSLRNAIAWWAGVEDARGYGESESYRRFFFRYGIDVANAQLLGTQESGELAVRILNDLSKFGIDGTVNAEIGFGI
jgi:DNA repair protein RadD